MFDTLAHLFTPRHSNNHRPRVLHPAGLVVFIAALLIGNSVIELSKLLPTESTGFVLGYASNISETQVLTLTNQRREEVGLQPLQLNDRLNQAARAKAADMFANGYWAHISPDGTTPWKFIKDTGYGYRVAGENLARDFDDTPSMVQAWMDSPTHKANVIHPKYSETGIAVVDGKLNGYETTLVVHMFAQPPTPVAEVPLAPQSPELASGSETANLEPLETVPTQLGVATPTPAYQGQAALGASYEKIYISPLTLKRSIVLSIVGLILAVLVLDEILIHRKQTIRFVGKNFAHISFLAVVVFIILTIIQPGGIL